MNKYYLVPVTSKTIKIKDKSLSEMLKNVDAELYVREKTRVDLTYESPISKILVESGYISGFNEYTSLLYQERGVPEKLILKQDDTGLHELFSGLEVNCDNESYLKVFGVSAKHVKDLLIKNSTYFDKVTKFIKKGNKKSKIKRKDSVKKIK